MKLTSRPLWGIGLLALMLMGQAEAAQVQIYGVSNRGLWVSLPKQMCVYTGSVLHVTADVIEPSNGFHYNVPYTRFIWTFVRANGFFDRFSPGSGAPGYGVFRQSYPFPGTLEVTIPADMGFQGSLQSTENTLYPDLIQLINVDQGHPGMSCQWAESEVYIGGPSVPSQGTGSPIPCYDRCQIGAMCTDGCPAGGVCHYQTPANTVPYWQVESCH